MNHLARHTETDANEQNLVYGALDSPLNHKGEYTGRRLGRIMSPKYFSRVYTSTASRTKRLYDLAGFEAKHLVHTSALDECHKGIFEGVPEEACLEAIKPVFSDPNWRFPGGESVNDMKARFNPFVDAEALTGQHSENKLFISSAGPIKGYLADKLGLSYKECFGIPMPNGGVYRFLLWSDGKLKLLEHLHLDLGVWREGLYPRNGRHVSAFMNPSQG